MYTAIDIGSANIKAIFAERNKNGKLSVLGMVKKTSDGLRKGILVEPEALINALKPVLFDLRQISKKAVQNIYVSVNGGHIRSYLSRGVAAVAKADSEIRQDDIDRAVRAAQAVNLPSNYFILHTITREFFVDDIGDIAEPLGLNGTRLEVSALLVGAFSPLIKNLVKCVEQAGGFVGGAIFNPLAASRALLSKSQKNLGSVLIDIGFETTTAAIFEENKILNAFSFPVGSGHLTNDLAVGLKIPVEKAESLKLSCGFALAGAVGRKENIRWQEFETDPVTLISKRFLSEIIEIRLAEILEFVNNELKRLGRNGQLPGGAVITGGGVKLPGIIDLAKQELRLSSQIGVADQSLFEVQNLSYAEMLAEPEFAVAAGLVLWAADNQKTSQFEPSAFLSRIIKNLMP